MHGEIPRFTVVVRPFGSPESGKVGNRVGRTPPVRESAAVRSLCEIQCSSRGLRPSSLGNSPPFPHVAGSDKMDEGEPIGNHFRTDDALLRAGENEVIAGGVDSAFVFSVVIP